ncbi:MAG: MFS transporter [Flavobacterium sp.]
MEESTQATITISRRAYKDVKQSYLTRIRWAVGLFYFGMGLCFSTWVSRIPNIREAMGMSEAELGTLLFCIPFGQLFIMPFSGQIVNKYGSHKTVVLGLCLYVCALTGLGFAQERWQLMAALFFFGIFSNLTNISVNTQGIYTEGLFRRAIMSSFHGAWSTAGFTGGFIGLGMMALGIGTALHFIISAGIILVIIALNYKFLVKVKSAPMPAKRKLFTKPDPMLLWLGVMAFCCMVSEGIMFDWSGVYFKDVVHVPESLTTLGFTAFMVMMALGRFMGDIVIQKFGRKKVLQIAGCLVSVGLIAAVLLPYIVSATIAFMIVGVGVSTIVPSIFGLAGRNPNVPPSIALQTVSSVSFLGFMIGPPVIGYIAHATSLRISFAIIAIFGFGIAFLTSKIKGIE